MTIQLPVQKAKSAAVKSADAAVKKIKSTDSVVPVPVAVTAAQSVDKFVDIAAAVDRACHRIAPLWPLRSFVAVNPFLGLADEKFEATARIMAQRAGAKMTAPRSFYAEAIRSGRITDADMAAALAAQDAVPGAPQDVAELRSFAFDADITLDNETLPTVADAAQQRTDHNWGRFITESISRWASSHFDQGQTYWPSPWRHLGPYAAWRAEAMLDHTPEVAGIRGFRQIVAQLPEDAETLIQTALARLDVPTDGLDAYLHRLLWTVGGWASYARYHLWQAELYGGKNSNLAELLAIRLAWEVALLEAFGNRGVVETWAGRKHELTLTNLGREAEAALAGDLLLQCAFEIAYQRQLMARLSADKPAAQKARTRVQAAFCIDVRSEVFRRSLESVDDGVETIGFAGFFGFPIEYVRLGEEIGGAQCPVLLTPQFVISESVRGASEEEEAQIREQRTLRQKTINAWRSFKFGAVSCFGFVGPVGLAYVKKIITDSLGKTRPVSQPAQFGLDQEIYDRLTPRLDPKEMAGRLTGMSADARVNVATGALTAMSLTDNFARLVLLVGHGSTTVNNPYASGLDCGACGGHTGEANTRVAAAVLNDPAVRAGLVGRGILVPDDTIFVAGQHDTTTDQITLFDKAQIPASHADDIAQIEKSFAAAGRLARTTRAPLLHIDQDDNVDAAVLARSRDWSNVRPEWGLAGCAAFIVAPRQRTYGLDLGGRSFLHSYEWQQDKGFGVLELIMTAPMVVASWINLQYYGSTVDNRVFGSGNKVLHNVVGTLGVLEGNGGDLRVGLPWQSVHDGESYIHEPLRLNVMIEAPLDAMTAIIAKHEGVRQLLDNGWVHLFALDETGAVSHRYAGNLTWQLAVG
jgi:uncharacterized protein YbcC (UPF0753/DUF2309 family)